MNEFMVHLVSLASINIFVQSTLSSFKNYFNEEINLEGDWRVALSEIIFPAKKSSEQNRFELILLTALYFMRKIFLLMLFPDHTEDKKYH